ncbi:MULTISPECIES: DUF4328 domain-containing protein [Streptomyces]|uniref:DUF4328 domain-containing protein n=1 Tax=Streptomyces TaxID=1883 RepID=UPI000B9E9723|nr:DUF4328 domain-containing protein [Streptomyces kasugaensis]
MSSMPVAPPPPNRYQSVPRAVLRSPVGLAKAVSILLAVVVVTDMFAVWADYQSLDMVNRLISDFDSVTGQEIDSVDMRYRLAGIVQSAALIATGVVFLVWFHRVRVNAEVFAPEYHAKKRGWTIWGWICPVVNLWFPRRIALDTWNASADENQRGAKLLNWWWALWLMTEFIGWAAGRQYARATTPEEIQRALGSVLVTDALDIVAAILAILFVRRLTQMQHEKALRGPSAPPFVPNLPAL